MSRSSSRRVHSLQFAVALDPLLGEPCEVQLAAEAELAVVRLGGPNAVVEVVREPLLEAVVGKLLNHDRRQADRHSGEDAVVHQPPE
jgi:hypothetical protein